MQRAARVAEMPVGDELERVHRRHPPKGVAGKQEPPGPRQHPHLPSVLVAALRRGLLVGDGLRLVDGAAAALDRERWEAEVVAEGRLGIIGAPDRVDRAVPAGDGAEL